MMEQICQWCHNSFESKRADKFCSLSCQDYAKGRALADKWAKGQKSPEQLAKMKKARVHSLVKMNNAVRFYPRKKSRFYKNQYGKIEY